MGSRIFAAVMAVLLLMYLVLVAQLAVRLITVDEPIAKALGVALFVLPLVGLWALIAEITFGVRSEHLRRLMVAEGEEVLAGIPRLPSGRAVRSEAQVVFERYKVEAEAAPELWESWYRLGLAYDACGDRRRARGAIRTAITLERR